MTTPVPTIRSEDDARTEIAEAIKRSGIIAIIRGDYSIDKTLSIIEALADESISTIEVALNSLRALDLIAAAKEAFGERTLLGAGTVLAIADLDAAVAAGARFAVAPNFVEDVHAHAHERGIFYLPGVLTPTEVGAAYTAGCTMQKLFPSDVFGPKYLTALRAPLREIEFVPTGGISAENVGAYIRAGAVAVGVGGWLVSPERSLDEMRARARELRKAWGT